MAYYRICPWCGAHLDPGERCDCGEGRWERITPRSMAHTGRYEQTEKALTHYSMGERKSK